MGGGWRQEALEDGYYSASVLLMMLESTAFRPLSSVVAVVVVVVLLCFVWLNKSHYGTFSSTLACLRSHFDFTSFEIVKMSK